MDDRGSPQKVGWKAKVRRWLWLDHAHARTDKSAANRGFYVGGPPVTWRFLVPLVAAAVVIALIILFVRGTEAQTPDDGQRLIFEEPGFAVTVPLGWEVRLDRLWDESGRTWAVASFEDGGSPKWCSFEAFHRYGPGPPWRFRIVHTDPAPEITWLDLPGGSRSLHRVLEP